MTAHSLALASNRSKKQEKTILSLLLPALHHITLRLPLRAVPSRTRMPLCLSAAARPIRRRSLAPIVSTSRPLPSRALSRPLLSHALVLVVLAPPVACAARSAEPRSMLVVLVEVVRARPGASAPTIQTKPTAGGGGACAPLLAAGSGPSSWNRPTPVFPSPMLHMYI
jgi:hypothetical protein